MVVLEKVFIIRWDSELEEGVFTIVWCSGVVTGPSMLTMDQQNLRLNKSSKIHLFILILQCFTFLVWSVGSTIHACIIWICKLVPVLGWNAEQPFYNLEGNKTHTIFTIETKLVSKNLYLCKILKAMCCLIRSLNSTQFFYSLYPWLSVGVMQDGHGIWVRDSMTYKSGAKDSGQVVYVHLVFHTLRHPGKREVWNMSVSTN